MTSCWLWSATGSELDRSHRKEDHGILDGHQVGEFGRDDASVLRLNRTLVVFLGIAQQRIIRAQPSSRLTRHRRWGTK